MAAVGVILFLTGLFLVTQKVDAQVAPMEACSGTQTAGTSDPSTKSTGPDTNRAFSYMVESPLYTFTCCGVITKWEFKAAKLGTLQFHVWRRKSTNVYELIGENQISVTSTSTTTLDVIAENRIIVQKGDFIGWHNQGDDMLYYEESPHFTASTLQNLFRRINAGDFAPGDIYDWSMVEAYNDRDYAIKVTYVASTAPTITPSDASLTMSDYLVQGTPIASFVYSDPDTSENSSLSIYQRQASAYYSVDLASGSVIVSTNLRPRSDTLEYVVYDLCYNTDDVSQSVTVTPVSPVIDNLDADFTVPESSTNGTLLHTITVTDYSDQWYCFSNWDTSFPFLLKATSNTSFPFLLKATSNVSYGIYLVEYPELNYESNPSYTSLSVTCRANGVTSLESDTDNVINVYVTKNYSPRIDNLDVAVAVNARTAVVGDTVYSVNATDIEGEVVEFTRVSCTGKQNSSAACPFTLMKNGDIQVNTNLLFDTNAQYTIIIQATDTDTNNDTGTVVISIEARDNPVSFQNFPPAGLQVIENQPVGTSIYTFAYEDLDNDAKTWSISYNDAKLTKHFSLDPTSGLLSTAYSVINFEDIGGPTFTATILIGDVQSTASQTLQITILNENEAPKFQQETYHIEFIEHKASTQITDGASLFTVTDEDAGDSMKYYLDCDNSSNTQRFYMTEGTGAIVYRGDMDLDDSSTPTDYQCTVTVVDSGGLNDTTLLYIHIVNANNNTPEFTSPSYTIYLPINILVGTSVLSISATDFDSSDDNDNEITYTLDQSTLTATGVFFAINQHGVIYTAKEMTTFNTGDTFQALASNHEISDRTGTATITVNILTTTTAAPTTTTDRNTGFYENTWNYYWLILTLGGAFCIVLAVSLVCFRICRLTRIGPWFYNVFFRPPPPRLKGFGEKGYDLASFGHMHVYTDEDEEIDGWLKNTRRKDQSYKKERLTSGGPQPVIVEADGRLSSVAGHYNEEPLHELRRLHTPGALPKAASYRDPIPRKSIKSKWKGTHRNRGSILKNSPSSWNK